MYAGVQGYEQCSLNTELKKNSPLIPFNSSPSKKFWDELKGDQPIIVLQFSVHSPWTSFSYMKSMNNDRLRSMIIAEAMKIDRYDHWSYWFMHECAVHAMKGYWSCMKTVDHSYEQALIMHDNVHIHVIMNIIMTPTQQVSPLACGQFTKKSKKKQYPLFVEKNI